MIVNRVYHSKECLALLLSPFQLISNELCPVLDNFNQEKSFAWSSIASNDALSEISKQEKAPHGGGGGGITYN